MEVHRVQDRLHRPRRCAQGERDSSQREGTSTAEAQRAKELEREVRQLRKLRVTSRCIEVLRKLVSPQRAA